MNAGNRPSSQLASRGRTSPPGARRSGLSLLAAALIPLVVSASTDVRAQDSPDFADAIAAMSAVGPEGAGNAAAAAAWDRITESADASVLPALLDALDEATPLAGNWLRSAIQTIVDEHDAATLPVDTLAARLFDTAGGVASRDAAYEILETVDPDMAARVVPGLLRDPSPELRRKAVQRLIDEAKALPEAEASTAALLYRQALAAATDSVQVETIAGALQDQGLPIDLPRHFGFLTHWHVVAPFDNTDRSGFEAVFPPENGVDLTASYPGKNADEPITWQPFASTHPYGKVDFNKPFGLLKGVTGYAYTEFESEVDRPAELRLGCKNGWKIWFNGEFIFGRDEYHRGQRIDQYRLPVQLKAGKNTVLVKLCQDEQEQTWTVEWEFQLRVCDASGVAILASDRLPTPVEEQTSSRRGAGARDTRDED